MNINNLEHHQNEGPKETEDTFPGKITQRLPVLRIDLTEPYRDMGYIASLQEIITLSLDCDIPG